MCDPLHVIVPVAVIPGCKSCGRLQRVLDLRHPSAIMSFDAVSFVVLRAWPARCCFTMPLPAASAYFFFTCPLSLRKRTEPCDALGELAHVTVVLFFLVERKASTGFAGDPGALRGQSFPRGRITCCQLKVSREPDVGLQGPTRSPAKASPS